MTQMMFHGSFGLSGGKQNKISLESVAAEALLARAASLQVTLVQLWRSDEFCSPSKGWLSVAAPPSTAGVVVAHSLLPGKSQSEHPVLAAGLTLGFTLLLHLECGAGEIL